jgi:RNA polymerase sigma-70 factor (ECF subfamily)
MKSVMDPLQLRGQSDADLVRFAAAGAQPAFAELVHRHAAMLRTHLRRMGAQGADADDMAQDAFIAAYEHLAEYRFDGPFSAWLKRIAARRYLRKLRASQKYLLVDDMTPYESPDSGASERPKAHNLDAALAQLRPAERLCVTLNFGGDLSHQDIADELKLPLGTVKSHIKRGLERLKAILDPHTPTEPVRAGS